MRDLAIAVVIFVALYLCHHLVEANPVWYLILPVCLSGFVSCFALCYIVHEWGHYIGAYLAGIKMPLSRYTSAFLGRFHIRDYDRRQYLWLSWGGDIGHVLVTLLACVIYIAQPGVTTGAFAIGGLAFSAQALAVDQPVIWRVTYGADIESTTSAGTQPGVIIKRTWQTWIPLGLMLLAFNLF